MFEWDDVNAIDDFILCIPLKIGSTIISVFGIIYGLITTYLFILMSTRMDSWKIVYASKLDELAYFFFIFAIVIIVLIASIMLMFGVWREKEIVILIYLWSIVVHIALDWVITLIVFVYCVFINQSCFMGSGVGQALVGTVLSMAYSVMWCYFIVTVNSCRMQL